MKIFQQIEGALKADFENKKLSEIELDSQLSVIKTISDSVTEKEYAFAKRLLKNIKNSTYLGQISDYLDSLEPPEVKSKKQEKSENLMPELELIPTNKSIPDVEIKPIQIDKPQPEVSKVNHFNEINLDKFAEKLTANLVNEIQEKLPDFDFDNLPKIIENSITNNFTYHAKEINKGNSNTQALMQHVNYNISQLNSRLKKIQWGNTLKSWTLPMLTAIFTVIITGVGFKLFYKADNSEIAAKVAFFDKLQTKYNGWNQQQKATFDRLIKQ